MKTFLAVYTGSPASASMASWERLPESERQSRQVQGMAAWKKWVEDNAASIVEMGGPLSRTRRIDPQGVADVRNNLSAFTIVRAESQEAAARLFLGHPHFSIFPGDGVEIMEVLAIPQG
jgi:hypothetical protein